MPTLVLQNTFTSGQAIAASDWNDNLYDPTGASTTSFEIINGHLEDDNMETAGNWALVSPEQVQRGTFGEMGFAAGTANLDFFNNWFFDILTTAETSTYPTKPIPLPGANRTFYVPYPSMVVMSWTVFWGADSEDANDQARMHLYIDDVLQSDGQRRETRRTSVGGADFYSAVINGIVKNRYWVGHHVAEMAQGWHTAGIRLVADTAVRQTRVWCRSFRYILLKKPATWG